MMQFYEMLQHFDNMKRESTQQGEHLPISDEALAILTLAYVIANCISNIERELEEIRVLI